MASRVSGPTGTVAVCLEPPACTSTFPISAVVFLRQTKCSSSPVYGEVRGRCRWAQSGEQESWVLIHALPLSSCVVLGEHLSLSGPQFPTCKMRGLHWRCSFRPLPPQILFFYFSDLFLTALSIHTKLRIERKHGKN